MAQPKFKQILKDLEEASAKPNNRAIIFDGSIDKIRAVIQNPNESKMCVAMGRLSSLSVWFGRLGAVQVLRGDTTGWANLKLSALYKYWYTRFFIHVFLTDTRISKSAQADGLGACLCLNHLLAIGAFGEAGWLGSAIKRSFQDKSLTWLQKLERPFEAFTPRLFNIGKRLHVNDGLAVRCSGVYQGILDNWAWNPEQLVAPVRLACDYHLSQVDDPNDDGYPEFIEQFYAAFPIEIIAIRRIRAALGLSTPNVDHPLLSTPLANPPASIAVPKDELGDRLLAIARSMWPKL